LAEQTLGFIPKVDGSVKGRSASEYVGGEIRVPTEDHDVTLALAF